MQNIEHQQKQIKVINWFEEKLKNNELDFKTRLKIFDIIMKDIKAMSISEYSRQNKPISYNGVLSKVQTGSLNALTFYGETLVFEEKKKEITYENRI